MHSLFTDVQPRKAIWVYCTPGGPACWGLVWHIILPWGQKDLEPVVKFNPLLFQVEELRPREGKQSSRSQRKLATGAPG